MKIPRDERGKHTLRTLDTLRADYLRFQTEGMGDTKNAKLFNNVINHYIFDIPLTQVSIQ